MSSTRLGKERDRMHLFLDCSSSFDEVEVVEIHSSHRNLSLVGSRSNSGYAKCKPNVMKTKWPYFYGVGAIQLPEERGDHL